MLGAAEVALSPRKAGAMSLSIHYEADSVPVRANGIVKEGSCVSCAEPDQRERTSSSLEDS